MGLVRVVQAWQAGYKNPITLSTGDRLHLSGRQYSWDGHNWLWAENDAGQQGWVPDDLPDDLADAATGTARYGFDAAELSCDRGEKLRLHSQTHGWAWCENALAGQGWVPLTCLHKAASTPFILP